VLQAPIERVHNEAFNVGRTDQNFRIRELAGIVMETVPNCEISFANEAGPDKRNYRVDCSKIQRIVPEFKPTWDARKGARELYEAYRRIGLELQDFEGPKYKRIDHIKMLITTGKLDDSLRWRSPETM
jgi:nucleoside-diphosphate-sugar epimerase